MPFTLSREACRDLSVSARREWLLTNGIGGYAMGTASGIATRRYHGLLVASTRPPAGRTVLLAAMDAFIQLDSEPVGISANQYPGAIYPPGFEHLVAFKSGPESVQWTFEVDGAVIVRRLSMHPGTNACTIVHENSGDRPVLLTLHPLVCHKPHHANFRESRDYPGSMEFKRGETRVSHQGIELRIGHPSAHRVPTQGWYYRFEHIREEERGLDPRDDLYSPCELRYELLPGERAVVTAAMDVAASPWEPDRETAESMEGLAARLRGAAGRFVVETPVRSSIIAGYPWFTDWGRDTMISLPGICLHTGRVEVARKILLDHAGALSHGLVPNRFVEVGETPEYNTVDATLWFANAMYRTLQAEWVEPFAASCLVALKEIFDWHCKGSLYGIGVDSDDGLLTQGAPGYQLTWMDAKVGEWVVTPRHGKPVEINGLWVNMLRIGEWLADRLGEDASDFRLAAEKAESNFERKFWRESLGHYLDTVDPTDASLRPNQVIAMSLPFSPAESGHARTALAGVREQLLTPVGLRTLGPKEPFYKARYEGPLAELDAAYHQGAVWPWLLGPYVDAVMRHTEDREHARSILKRAGGMLDDYGIDGIAEVYDGSEPQRPNGCPWQAWSVAEILRALVEHGFADET